MYHGFYIFKVLNINRCSIVASRIVYQNIERYLLCIHDLSIGDGLMGNQEIRVAKIFTPYLLFSIFSYGPKINLTICFAININKTGRGAMEIVCDISINKKLWQEPPLQDMKNEDIKDFRVDRQS